MIKYHVNIMIITLYYDKYHELYFSLLQKVILLYYKLFYTITSKLKIYIRVRTRIKFR